MISGGRGEDTLNSGWAPAGVRVRVGLHPFIGGSEEFPSGFEDVANIIRGPGRERLLAEA